MQKYTHIIWDWNGTLLDDIACCVEIINSLLRSRGLPVFESPEEYRRAFRFPVRAYYKLIGLDTAEEPFEKIAVEFIKLYYSSANKAALFPGAADVVSAFQDKGLRQVILSASELQYLLMQIKAFGIDIYFDEILGASDIYAAGKIDIGKAYIRRASPVRAVLIGDTAHDKEVADALGVDCVLIAGGHQTRETLLSSGATVVDCIRDITLCIKYKY